MARVLVIDDDASVAELVADVVEFCKHTPIVERDPLEAVARWVKHPEIAAVLTDYMMPRLSGIDVLNIFLEQRPLVRRILITAAPTEEEVRRAVRDGVVQQLIAKPGSINDIKQALLWL